MTTVSTHVLDTSRGVPAAGVGVELLASVDGDWTTLGSALTGGDGRAAGLEPARPGGAGPGLHRLVFATGAYQRSVGAAAFVEEAAINFQIADEAYLHIPLLLSPYGLSIYRGS